MKDRMRIDLDEDIRPWRYGLTTFAAYAATVQVTVDGIAAPLEGRMLEQTEDFVMLETSGGDDVDCGEAIWIRRDRIITVSAPFEIIDRYRDAKRRIEADPSILDRVREAVEAFPRPEHDRIARTGTYPTYSGIAATLEGISPLMVEAAMDLLEESS